MEIGIALPAWVDEAVERAPRLDTLNDRMSFVIGLSALSVSNATGGPFAAAVFDRRDRTLVAASPNLVTSARLAIAHAEVVALSLAQVRRRTFDLAEDGGAYELVTSAEPCAMCLGATCWSGVTAIACGARRDDVEAIGFDEGPRPSDWAAALAARGIEVTRDVMRAEAVAVLARYQEANGLLYNGRASRSDRDRP